MTDTNVRNVLFDPRCGWVLISNGVYLGTSRTVGRGSAMRVLNAREKECGLREPITGDTPARHEVRERTREAWERDARRREVRVRIRREG